ncbi:effector-binding domain-containing protein [Ancylobacter sp. 3268]|uniref:GyrI-like domain-containing protein n=1 Tax=Ancylobacter sp. 3268 TaxID=2817752 RepID=UPI0028647202|nr:GyrI-like domain-containing protein [Ancylobacter sp. 3268]MDR6951491.1 effector-binding domain-containing protein [Ancylobacter sp. 3268]
MQLVLRLLNPLTKAAFALALLAMAAPPAQAQAPAPAPATPAPGAPTDKAPETPSDGQGDLVAPPVIDPKGVDTSSVPLGGDPLQRPDGFGDPAEMVPVPVLQKSAKSNWDEGFATIVATLKTVYAELDRLKLKRAGAPFIIYTMTDDEGFSFEAAVPFSGATTEKPGDGLEFSASPAGKALRFTHRGPYDAMDPTYEQIANLLDAKDLEAQDLYVEEYRADPTTTPDDDLVIDIWVPLK